MSPIRKFCSWVLRLKLRFLLRILTAVAEIFCGPVFLRFNILCDFDGCLLLRVGVSTAFGPRRWEREGVLLLFAFASCDACRFASVVFGLDSVLKPRFSPYDDFGRTVLVPELTEGGLMPDPKLPVYEELELEV